MQTKHACADRAGRAAWTAMCAWHLCVVLQHGFHAAPGHQLPATDQPPLQATAGSLLMAHAVLMHAHENNSCGTCRPRIPT
mmetsp:Transcript_31779/g.70591  ORF Transcript_31779/g.70591 Transcript_31779/m.70591 type:complete len:81 (-) Transcript_31779:756-998(-)